ncbi:MAG: FAD-dependent oxidoreductase [Streptosporangiaceae bacterium]|nr:FAD-dependent oxidoreductase [Streptosporangiaceae bacterium]
MTQTATGRMGDLRAVMEGPVIAPGDPGFDDGRRVWNAGIDRRPSLIARCASPADVSAAMGYAREHGLEVSVRGGAHNPAGTAVCDDGVMIDLSLLDSVVVDPAARRARVGGGALLADLDAATLAHGLAVPAGMVSHTGVGGLTLGGGMGWLTRKFGLSIDNLISAEVVTADGQVLRASADEHPGLFWAIRGGGGNFGVVTSFEFALHELDPMVQFGLFFWGLDQGPQALRLAREITVAMPPDINAVVAAVNAPPAPFVPAAAPPHARLRAAADRLRIRAAARPACHPDPGERPAAVRPGRSDALRRPAENARRSQRLGPIRLREGNLRRGPVRSGDRSDHRARPAQELADVGAAVLPA